MILLPKRRNIVHISQKTKLRKKIIDAIVNQDSVEAVEIACELGESVAEVRHFLNTFAEEGTVSKEFDRYYINRREKQNA